MSDTAQFLIVVAAIVASWQATKVTTQYAQRPSGILPGQQVVLPDGRTTFPGPYGGLVDSAGQPVQSPPPPREKALWWVWGQMFLIIEGSAIVVIALATGWFGI